MGKRNIKRVKKKANLNQEITKTIKKPTKKKFARKKKTSSNVTKIINKPQKKCKRCGIDIPCRNYCSKCQKRRERSRKKDETTRKNRQVEDDDIDIENFSTDKMLNISGSQYNRKSNNDISTRDINKLQGSNEYIDNLGLLNDPRVVERIITYVMKKDKVLRKIVRSIDSNKHESSLKTRLNKKDKVYGKKREDDKFDSSSNMGYYDSYLPNSASDNSDSFPVSTRKKKSKRSKRGKNRHINYLSGYQNEMSCDDDDDDIIKVIDSSNENNFPQSGNKQDLLFWDSDNQELDNSSSSSDDQERDNSSSSSEELSSSDTGEYTDSLVLLSSSDCELGDSEEIELLISGKKSAIHHDRNKKSSNNMTKKLDRQSSSSSDWVGSVSDEDENMLLSKYNEAIESDNNYNSLTNNTHPYIIDQGEFLNGIGSNVRNKDKDIINVDSIVKPKSELSGKTYKTCMYYDVDMYGCKLWSIKRGLDEEEVYIGENDNPPLQYLKIMQNSDDFEKRTIECDGEREIYTSNIDEAYFRKGEILELLTEKAKNITSKSISYTPLLSENTKKIIANGNIDYY